MVLFRKEAGWIVQSLFALSYYPLAGAFIGAALVPPAGLLYIFAMHSGQWSPFLRLVVVCLLCGIGWFIFGFTLLVLIVALNRLLKVRLPEGTWRIYDLRTWRWTFHNSWVALADYIFLKYLFASPFVLWFFRGMGSKMGKRIQLNSGNLTDVYLIEIGDDCVIGAQARLIPHQISRGRFTLRRIRIGKRVTVGISSTVSLGVEIGDGATIMPNSFVLKNTKIPPGTVWGGVPAVRVSRRPVKTAG